MKNRENIKQFRDKIQGKFLKLIFKDQEYQDQKMHLMIEVTTDHKQIVNNPEYQNLS